MSLYYIEQHRKHGWYYIRYHKDGLRQYLSLYENIFMVRYTEICAKIQVWFLNNFKI